MSPKTKDLTPGITLDMHLKGHHNYISNKNIYPLPVLSKEFTAHLIPLTVFDLQLMYIMLNGKKTKTIFKGFSLLLKHSS